MKVLRFFGRLISRLVLNSKMSAFLLFVAVIAGLAAYYFYQQNQKTLRLLNNPSVASEEEVRELTEKVSTFMELPSDEKPTVITVVDKEKLKEQPFFNRAENGDKVLVYTQTKKAIMYRPTSNKIIEVGPVEMSPNQTFKVALYNGSGSEPVLAEIEKTLKEKVTNLEVVAKAVAKGDYDKTLVVDIKGDKKAEAEQLAKLLSGEVSSLPVAETKPDTDFLIIAGQSQ